MANQMRLEEVIKLNEEIRNRVAAHADYMVLGTDGEGGHWLISTTMDLTSTNSYVGNVPLLTLAARSACRDLEPDNEMIVLRVGTRKNEVIVTNDQEFSIIAVQKKAAQKKSD